ncbi:alpha/beta fold hydrolase [Halovenus salina]|uniref:Alpha/beta fold hydrolase n=1 Tax=Halovenus salina TaxID=1510225 RepID=A0ABD5W668_9EURY|nr:alpha/beta hydrolase [Halovenus salina]
MNRQAMHLPDGWTADTVTANGIDIGYYRTGSGPPVVMAHGMYDSGRRWVPLAEALAEEYEVITYDARGHGRSAAPESGYDIDSRVADLVGLVKELGLTDPILLGHSMGAATVAWAAASTPDLPAGLVLEDPARFRDTPELSVERAEEITRQKLSESQSRPIEERVDELAEDHDIERDHARRLAVGTDECSPTIARIAQEHDPVTDAFEDISTPTLVLRRDVAVSERVSDHQAAEQLAEGRLVHVPGAGHYIFRDEYEAAYAELQTFLERC